MRRVLPALCVLWLPQVGCVSSSGELAARPVGGGSGEPACEPGDLSDEGLPIGRRDQAYVGAALVRDYRGDATWTLIGDAPAGLGVGADGAVTGTPTQSGRFALRLRAQGMTDHPDVAGCLYVWVNPGADERALGFARTQDTAITLQRGVQTELWVRLAGAGVDDQSENTFDFGAYEAGPDGVHAAGRGDDVRVADVSGDDVEIVLGAWASHPERPDHSWVNEPPEHLGGGRFVAGGDTGEWPMVVRHPTLGAISTKLQVVPPDWCPDGVSSGPGNGSCQ